MLKCMPWDKCWMNVRQIPLMRRDTLAKKNVFCLAQNTIRHANVKILFFGKPKRSITSDVIRQCASLHVVRIHLSIHTWSLSVRPLLFFRSEFGEAHHDTPIFRMAHRAIPDWITSVLVFWSLSQRSYTLIDCCWRCLPRIYMRIQIWKHDCQCF